ncbi:hypothetical protein ZWY2020_040854 [Hordeum vulgare]|nr:hypothetical protein ZWY2020_040854 [Hordeum vulgare]
MPSPTTTPPLGEAAAASKFIHVEISACEPKDLAARSRRLQSREQRRRFFFTVQEQERSKLERVRRGGHWTIEDHGDQPREARSARSRTSFKKKGKSTGGSWRIWRCC